MITHPWAKLKREDGQDMTSPVVDWHPLVAHSAEVAACLEMLLRHTMIGTRMAYLMGQDALMETQIQRFGALAVLHDAGKVNQGFQNRAFGNEPTSDHVTPMVGMLDSEEHWKTIEDALQLSDMHPWFGDMWDTMDWLHTTWSHHGSLVEKAPPKKGLWPSKTIDQLSEVGTWARGWYPKAFGDAPPFTRPEVQHLFNGALTLADWIGSDTTFFGFDATRIDPATAIDDARKDALGAFSELGLMLNTDVDASLSTILGGYEPYEVQAEVQRLPTSTDGTLSILESATGSGKTEAALGRYARLLKEGLVDSMYFAVPTRAAAKQLQHRVKEVRDAMFGTNHPPVHLAVPGYLKVDDVEGTRFGWQVRWDEDVDNRGWAAESSKRYMASPIAVGTIDQVLLTTLRVRHAHLRLAGLARSFLVVDEVHASSTYMNELLHNVLTLHQQMGGHALLMSATLGSSARATFTGEDPPSFEEAQTQHYPLVSHVNGGTVIDPKKPRPPTGDEKQVALDLAPLMRAPEAIARRAEAAAAEGAHVLIIRNTVSECQRVFEEIDSQYAFTIPTENGAVSAPHHSRYCAQDREQLDKQIERTYGKNEVDGQPTRTHRGGVITVATQTVEQSLDIDADLLITDLCPMDVLLQRIGRLHRHDRTDKTGKSLRPDGYETARCVVLTPSQRSTAATIKSDTGKGYPGPGLGSVYDDLRIIEATWQALEKRNIISIPRDNRTLVEEATHCDMLSEIEQADARWAAHVTYLRTGRREEMLGAKNATLSWDKPFVDDSNGFSGERFTTRLGEQDIVVALPEPMQTPFGQRVEEMTLSPYLFGPGQRPENGVATNAHPVPKGFAFTFAGTPFTYTNCGIQKRSST